ncbi:MAG: flavodoxin domain-containing protein [Friedmanniella sp.]|jgi:menaquinone-dependent protoporphyrinogen oxidase
MSRVLVGYASRMGSTREIAQTVGQQLQAAGFEVEVHSCEHAPDARNFDAVVLGSAIYLRRWRSEALRYLRTQASDLAERPTWLFQSGPCGEGSEAESVPAPRAVRRLTSRVGLNPPTTFGGRLEAATAVGPLSRWMADGALAGDFRDWDRIRRWTDDIIANLTARDARHQPSSTGGEPRVVSENEGGPEAS